MLSVLCANPTMTNDLYKYLNIFMGLILNSRGLYVNRKINYP